MEIRHGFAETDRPRVAELYWGAFQDKLGRIMGPDAKALLFLERNLDPTHAICVYDQELLLGVAGFKTAKGALVGGTLATMAATYGWPGALWRGALLGLIERDVDNARFLLDGLFVAPEARGRGAGTMLLDAVAEEARARGYGAIRLDVIDRNTRARALYERQGFEAVETQSTSILAPILGFQSSVMMVRTL